MLEFKHPNLTVMGDLFEGGKIAAEYVAEKLNHVGRAVCVSAGVESTPTTGQYRLNGFCSALQAFPEIQVDSIPAYWSYSRAYPALLDALAKVAHRTDCDLQDP
jgi:ABC-type sugar transport system substrate-binding protein